MNDKTIKRVIAFFLVISAILVFVALGAVRNINRSAARSDWVNHTHAVILEADGVLSSARAADAAMLAFVVSGDPRDRAACREALSDLSDHVEVAKALTREEPAQHAPALQLEAAATQRADFIGSVLAAQAAHPEKVHALLAADAGAGTTKEIRRIVRKLKEDEMALLAARDTASYLQAQWTRWTMWLGAALDVLLLGGVVWLIRDDLAARRRVVSTLMEANATLEARVLARTSELAAANDQLTGENLERRWANQALEHQLRYNQLIVDSVKDAVFVLTKAMNVSRINPAAVHLTGWDAPSLVNRPLSSVVRLASEAAEEEAPMLDPMTQSLKDGREFLDQSAMLTDRRGRQVRVHLSLLPLRDGDKVVGGIALLRASPAPSPAL